MADPAAMGFLIGTDEAGYGPNLGPLLISATVWQVDDAQCDLYDLLRSAVTNRIDTRRKRIAIADSKLLFKPGSGLARLETPLFATHGNRNHVRTWKECWQYFANGSFGDMARLPWYQDFDCPLPIDANEEELRSSSDQWTRCLERNSVSLRSVRSIAVFPEQFNAMVRQFDSKGAALSNVTLDLVASLISELESEPIRVVCDKHGGRNSYAGFLQPRFGDRLVRVHHESRKESLYEIGTFDQPISISFRSKGESFLPSALASIASKYLRELAMLAFNRFWVVHSPGVKPTAGYPVDANRFRIDVAHAKEKLKIDDDIFWRIR